MADAKTNKTTEDCPLPTYKLVDLVEVVTQGEVKMVKGAAMDSANTKIFTDKLERTNKDKSNFKQYINLNPDLDGADKRNPEYGRKITFRVRVEQKDGKTDKLAGAKVVFSFKRTDGPNRKNPGGTKPEVWKKADLDGSQKEGFNKANGDATTTKTTDKDGWTSEASFYLTQFAGDQFEISAKLDPSTKGAADGKELKTAAKYVVWRKFWYQLTHADADSYTPPEPDTAKAAYTEVFADMIKANTKKFKKTDLASDLQDRTFYKEFMLKQGGSATKTVANVGDNSNIDEFKTNDKLKLTKEPKKHPVKENLIVCEFQCDPQGVSTLKTYKLTADNQSIKIITGASGPIISKPAIKKGAKLVVTGEWSKKESPWVKEGLITDANILIDSGRTSTQHVKIKLPTGAGAPPTPTTTHPIFVRLQLETAKNYLGWATSGGIVAVFRPGTAAGQGGSKEVYNIAVAHEFGHKWKMVPIASVATALKMKNHPYQYQAHGGSGSHCRHAATFTAGTINWQDASEKTPVPSGGDCVMFGHLDAANKTKFCESCKPYLQLQDMSSL